MLDKAKQQKNRMEETLNFLLKHKRSACCGKIKTKILEGRRKSSGPENGSAKMASLMHRQGNWCKYGKWLARSSEKCYGRKRVEAAPFRPDRRGILFIATVCGLRWRQGLPALDIFI